MKEISSITIDSREESGNEILTSQILASEVYARAKNEPHTSQTSIDTNHDAGKSEQSVASPGQIIGGNQPEAEKYYRLGHTEDESFRHVAQTWRHVLNGNGTKLELLEFGIEAAGAVAMLRFGVKKFWPMNALAKAPVVSAADDTILSQTLTGTQAKNHPVMKAFIRTHEAPVYIPR